MYEIAICVNALCFDKRASKFFLNKKKVKNLIKGYESVKKVSIKEKKSLNILCRGAAMRYFLTRLFDYSNTPKSALIKIKDPREYYQKLVIHNSGAEAPEETPIVFTFLIKSNGISLCE